MLLLAARASWRVVVLLAGFLLPRIVNGGPLLDARVVTLPLDLGVWWEGQNALHGLPVDAVSTMKFVARNKGAIPDLEDSSAIVTSPDAQDILSITHAEHSSAYLLARFRELVPDDSEKQILPISICHALLQSYDPFAALSILGILPDRPDPPLKNMIIRDQRQR